RVALMDVCGAQLRTLGGRLCCDARSGVPVAGGRYRFPWRITWSRMRGHARREMMLWSGAKRLGITAVLTMLPFLPSSAETTLTWGKPSEMTGLDPQFSGDGTSWAVFYFVYQRMFTTTDDLKPSGQLVEAWKQVSPTEYTFKLRHGATFSNGRSLLASDVVGSFKRLMDPKRGAAWGRQLKAVKEVTAIDDHTVSFDWSEPLTPLLAILAVSPTAIMPMKEIEDGSFDPDKGMLGSGPYVVVDHKQDEYWRLARNPHYWREGHPIADHIVI